MDRRTASKLILLGTLGLTLPAKAEKFRLNAGFIRGEFNKEVWFNARLYYDISYEEYKAQKKGTSLYGGCEFFIFQNVVRMVNHGRNIAIKGEPSLERLVSRITKDNQSDEERAVALYDFVCNNMNINRDGLNESELGLRKPYEILFGDEGDCSEVAILYASLLEQTDIDYLLVDFPGHIAVAVAGDFSRSISVLRFEHNGQQYNIAAWEIGRPNLFGEIFTSNDIGSVQKPSEVSVAYDYKTGEQLDCYWI